MDTTRTAPSAQQAREQLATAQARTLGSARDRRVRAAGTALIGVGVAAYGTASVLASGGAGVALSAVFVVAALALQRWVERASATVPRRATVISRAGVIASFVLVLVAVAPWLNLAAQTSPVTWPTVVTGSVVTAAPALVAAAVIAGRGR